MAKREKKANKSVQSEFPITHFETCFLFNDTVERLFFIYVHFEIKWIRMRTKYIVIHLLIQKKELLYKVQQQFLFVCIVRYRNAKIIPRLQKVQWIFVSPSRVYILRRVSSVFKISDEYGLCAICIWAKRKELGKTDEVKLVQYFYWYLYTVCVCVCTHSYVRVLYHLFFVRLHAKSLLLCTFHFCHFSVCVFVHYKWSLCASHVVHRLLRTPYWACK